MTNEGGGGKGNYIATLTVTRDARLSHVQTEVAGDRAVSRGRSRRRFHSNTPFPRQYAVPSGSGACA